jgi:adenylylsulfate kinase
MATMGCTVWLTGLSGAGKSTLAIALVDELHGAGHRAELLDGDELRAHMSAGLGFSHADRDVNVLRAGHVARLLSRNGVVAVVAMISPYAATRDRVRQWHRADRTPFVEVHVSTPLGVCRARDPKGLYAKQANGLVTMLSGVDDPYESPRRPALAVDTSREPLATSLARLRAVVDASRTGRRPG